MKAKLWLLMAVVAGLVVSPNTHSSADDFYKGKTIHFVVGLAPGGGYDLSARTGRATYGQAHSRQSHDHRRKHDGAGSLVAANYTYNSAKPDGLFVGIWNSAMVLRQALGDRAMRFDARKFGWVGAPTVGTPYCKHYGPTPN